MLSNRLLVVCAEPLPQPPGIPEVVDVQDHLQAKLLLFVILVIIFISIIIMIIIVIMTIANARQSRDLTGAWHLKWGVCECGVNFEMWEFCGMCEFLCDFFLVPCIHSRSHSLTITTLASRLSPVNCHWNAQWNSMISRPAAAQWQHHSNTWHWLYCSRCYPATSFASIHPM